MVIRSTSSSVPVGLPPGSQAAFVHYRAMVQACYCKTHKTYPGVGGKGIGMCKPWRQKFENFLKDMGEPEPNQRLVRIDVSGPFNKDNVQWCY